MTKKILSNQQYQSSSVAGTSASFSASVTAPWFVGGSFNGLALLSTSATLAGSALYAGFSPSSTYSVYSNTTLQERVYVKNGAGQQVYKGQAVYISGANGTNPIISLAQGNSEDTSSKTLGLLEQDLAINDLGYVVTSGILAGFNTSAAGTEGDPIWLSPASAGGLLYGVANKPLAPNHLVYLGVVTRKHATVGEVFVHVQNGPDMEEIHNVYAASAVNGDVLVYNTSCALWISSSYVPYSQNAVTASNGLFNLIVTASQGIITSGSVAYAASAGNAASTTQTSFNNLNVTSSVTIGGNLNITGDLYVGGTTASITASSLFLNDPLLYLAHNNTTPDKDIGIVGSFTDSGSYQHTGLVRDASDNYWKLFSGVTAEPTTVVDFSSASLDTLLIGRGLITGKSLNSYTGGGAKNLLNVSSIVDTLNTEVTFLYVSDFGAGVEGQLMVSQSSSLLSGIYYFEPKFYIPYNSANPFDYTHGIKIESLYQQNPDTTPVYPFFIEGWSDTGGTQNSTNAFWGISSVFGTTITGTGSAIPMLIRRTATAAASPLLLISTNTAGNNVFSISGNGFLAHNSTAASAFSASFNIFSTASGFLIQHNSANARDPFIIRLNTGAQLFYLSASGDGFFRGNLTAGSTISIVSGSTARMSIYTAASTIPGILVQGASLQTANLQIWRDAAGTTMGSIGPTGTITSASNIIGITASFSNASFVNTIAGSIQWSSSAALSASSIWSSSINGNGIVRGTVPVSALSSSVIVLGTSSLSLGATTSTLPPTVLSSSQTIIGTSSVSLGAQLTTIAGLTSLTSTTLTGTTSSFTTAVGGSGSFSGNVIYNQATNAQTAASYTLVLADSGKFVEMGNASLNFLIIPSNANAAFATGARVDIIQTSSGTTVLSASSGVTLNFYSPTSATTASFAGQWSAVTLVKRASDTWAAIGNIK